MTAGFERVQRGARVDPDGERVPAADHLDPVVVPDTVLATAGQLPDRTAGEPQRDDGGVHVAGVGERLVDQHRTDRMHLDHRLADQPRHRVQIVDEQVPVDPAGGRQVGRVGWSRVHRQRPHQVDGAQLTGHDPTLQLGDRRVEPALETDQHRHPAGLDLLDHAQHRDQVAGQRLLAQCWDAGLQAALQHRSVTRRRGGDQHAVRGQRLVQVVHRPDRRGSPGRGQAGRQLGRPAGHRVVQQHLRDVRDGGQVDRVHAADPAGAGHRYPHRRLTSEPAAPDQRSERARGGEPVSGPGPRSGPSAPPAGRRS